MSRLRCATSGTWHNAKHVTQEQKIIPDVIAIEYGNIVNRLKIAVWIEAERPCPGKKILPVRKVVSAEELAAEQRRKAHAVNKQGDGDFNHAVIAGIFPKAVINSRPGMMRLFGSGLFLMNKKAGISITAMNSSFIAMGRFCSSISDTMPGMKFFPLSRKKSSMRIRSGRRYLYTRNMAANKRIAPAAYFRLIFAFLNKAGRKIPASTIPA